MILINIKPEQIKTEYKRLALRYHPDKTSNTESEQFKKIKNAYDIVGNPVNRAMYERWRSSNLIISFSDFAQLGTHAQVSIYMFILDPILLIFFFFYSDRLYTGKQCLLR